MQIQELPITLEDMRYSVSVSGITELKAARYKARHGGLKDLAQRPGRLFVKPEKQKSDLKRKKRKQKTIIDADLHDISQTTAPKQVRTYRIDKPEVKRRIHGYVNAMSGEKRLFFWTISFPQFTTDDTAFLLMNKWLTRLRKEKMLKDYLWITERQQNGTIHFHIIINNRMCVKKANRFMRASIMHSINDGTINWSREAAKRYNGVDIAKDRKTKKVINFAKQSKQKALTAYITKYITKNDTTFTHLAWHSSRGYSNIITSIRLTQAEFDRSPLSSLINTDKAYYHDYYIHYPWTGSPPNYLTDYLAFITRHIQSLLN